MKIYKGSFRSPGFKLFLFSWLIAFIAALLIAPLHPLGDDYSFLKPADHPNIQPAYALFSSLLGVKSERLDENTDLEKLNAPFVVFNLKARSVEENLGSKSYGMIDAYLRDIESSQDPYCREKARDLRLITQYSTGQYEPFLSACSRLYPLPRHLIVPLVHARMMTRNESAAQSLFNQHFQTLPLNTWSATLPPSALNGLIRGLPEPIWLNRLDQLQRQEQLGELRGLLRLRNVPERSQLLEATALYNQREYNRSAQLLAQIKSSALLPWKEYMQLKIDARQGRIDELTVRSKQHRYNKAVYLLMLSDIGGILIANNNDSQGLEFYARYIDEVESLWAEKSSCPAEDLVQMLPLSEHDELYWQIVFRSAWLHFKKDNRATHRVLLEKCLQSPQQSIRQNAIVWLAEHPQDTLPQLSPYGYEYARLQGPLTRQHLLPFLDKIAGPLPLTRIEQNQLTDLFRYGLYREAAAYSNWLGQRYAAKPGARHVLAICEAISLARQEKYPQAFNTFKAAFTDYSDYLLPRYLAFLILPLDHQTIIRQEAVQNGLDPLLVTSLVRQESFFVPGAASSANAHGLMQLLPRSAQEVSTSAGRITPQDLYRPETNIALGCRYLKNLLDRYNKQTHLALAAYNAGPERVDQWLALLGKIPPEEFIEMIPFSETRLYVKNILRNMYFYRHYYPEVFPAAKT